MWTAHPLREIARTATRQRRTALRELAERSWQIAPGEEAFAGGAYFLPGQLERVTDWAFADEHPLRQMMGGYMSAHDATSAYLVRDAVLVDGRLFKGGACHHLHRPSSRTPLVRIEGEIARAALYCTPGGIQYFGQWLMDDCNTYLLARDEGVPLSTAHGVWPHTADYEAYLDMQPMRAARVFIREAIVFEDVGQNANKHERARALRAKLLSHAEERTHAGVFIVRGTSGQRRVLLNEMEIAEALSRSRGLKIVDPEKMSVAEIVSACAGAQMVVGVEGSGLMHGIALLPQGGKVLALQPPNRFVGLYKHLTDRDGQQFGFVVGASAGGDFTVDLDEVQRTIDLFPAASAG